MVKKTKYQNIPSELRACRNWVVTKPAPDPKDPSKLVKPPISAVTGSPKEWNKGENLATFEQAVAWCESHEGYLLGFSFKGTPFGAFDLDKVCDEPGGMPRDSVNPLMSVYGKTYCERSLSGTGFKLVFKKSGSEEGLSQHLEQQPLGDGGAVEMFLGGYCVLTGDKVGTLWQEGDPLVSVDPMQAWNFCKSLRRGTGDATVDAAAGRNNALTQYVGRLARMGLSADEMRELLYWKNRQFPEPLSEKEIRETVERSLAKWAKAEGQAGDPLEMFGSKSYFESLPPMRWLIEGLAQESECTMFAALPKANKTWVLLLIAKSLLTGEPLFGWGRLRVHGIAKRIVYLIPEAGARPVYKRLKLLGLDEHIYDKNTNPLGRLLIRTLSQGEKLSLKDERLLSIAEGADIFLDTIVRFVEGDENSSSDVKNLSDLIFNLLGIGARSVWGAHHAAKGFENVTEMTLANALRGSGEFGAAVSNAYGLFVLDKETNLAHVKCLDARDLEEYLPDFHIQGKPFLSTERTFRVVNEEAGRMSDHLRDKRKPGAQEDPQKKEKVAFIFDSQLENRTGQVMADAVNQKFGSNHSRQVIAAWVKAEKEIRSGGL